jgi:hypothetical protein
MAQHDLKHLALLGAQARIQQIEAEMQEILRMFPQLRSGARLRPTLATSSGNARPKRKFSAKGKQAISEGMRKYWARRKAKAGSKSGRSAQASE